MKKIVVILFSLLFGLSSIPGVNANLLESQNNIQEEKEMTQTYKVQVSMNQAHIVESGFVWKQGDFGFNIEIEVLDFDTTGATPQIIFRKSTGAVEATEISVAGNKFTYAIRGTELDTPGPCVCDLKLNDSTTKRVSTASFKYFVIPDTMDGLEQEASSYSDTIEQLLENTLQKSETTGLVKNDGSINSTIEETVETQTTQIDGLKDAVRNILLWPLRANLQNTPDCKTNIKASLTYETGFYKPQSKTITSAATTYRTYYIDVLPGEQIDYYVKFDGGSSANILAYCRFLNSEGDIISESLSSSGTNYKIETVTVPASCTRMTLTENPGNYGMYIAKRDISLYDMLPDISEYVQNLTLQKSRRLKAKTVKTGIYFGYNDINASATTYSMHVYDVIPGEKVHVLTRYTSGSSANATNCVRFYNSDGTVYGIIQNESSGVYTFDRVIEVPYYAATMEVVADGETTAVTSDYKTPYVAVENETAIFIGDSYTQANSLETAGFYKQKRFSTLLSRYYGWNEKNYAVGGMGFIWGDTPFIDQLNNAIADTSYDHSRVTKVFICGGRNDGQISEFDPDEYVTAVQTVLTTARNAYPNADIILVPMMWDSTIVSSKIYKQYCLITNAAYGKEVTIIPNAYQWLIGFKGYILSDNVHPNVEGHAVIFNHILNALTTGYAYPYPIGVKLDIVSQSIDSSGFFNITQENGLLRFQMSASVSNDIPRNTTLFSYEVSDSLNNPVLFTRWGITMFIINNHKEFGAFYVTNTYTESGYVIEVKSSGTIKAGNYYEYNFSIPFGLEAYA